MRYRELPEFWKHYILLLLKRIQGLEEEMAQLRLATLELKRNKQ